MAIIMISELPGAGPEFADVARQQGAEPAAPAYIELLAQVQPS